MKFRFPLLIPVFLLFALTFSACGGEEHCLGLSRSTGTANSSRSARKGNRGGYKSPRELDARDRQHKRLKKRQKQSMRKSRGGGNTTGHGKKFSGSAGGSFSIGGHHGSAHANGSVKY